MRALFYSSWLSASIPPIATPKDALGAMSGPRHVFDNFETINHSNQNANWVEFLIGIKVETIKNIYFGISLRLNRLISNSSPNNFTNLYIPGFNKVTDDNSWGSGFNYTLTYSLPLKFNKKAPIK